MTWEYEVDKFEGVVIESWQSRFQTLLLAAASSPISTVSVVPIMSACEADMINGFNTTGREFCTASVVEQILKTCNSQPNQVAVADGQGQMTYAQLQSTVLALADTLHNLGLGVGDCVAVLVPRDRFLVASVLGVLAARCAFVPIDITFPQQRIQFILDDANCKAAISYGAFEQLLANCGVFYVHTQDVAAIPKLTTESLRELPSPSDLAYIMYTSGSTVSQAPAAN